MLCNKMFFIYLNQQPGGLCLFKPQSTNSVLSYAAHYQPSIKTLAEPSLLKI